MCRPTGLQSWKAMGKAFRSPSHLLHLTLTAQVIRCQAKASVSHSWSATVVLGSYQAWLSAWNLDPGPVSCHVGRSTLPAHSSRLRFDCQRID